MDDQMNSKDINENKDEKSDKPSKLQYSQIPDSESADEVADQTVFTDNTEESSTDISVDVFSEKKGKCIPAGQGMQKNSKCGSTSVACTHSPRYVKTNQPRALHNLLSPSASEHTLPEASQFLTSTRGLDSLKTTAVHSETDESDLCAAVLLACLFCHPMDCLLETFRGCNMCIWSLCSSLCGCEPTALQPLINITQSFDLCVGCFLCNCTSCDICLPATECLDLAMEISQMLYH